MEGRIYNNNGIRRRLWKVKTFLLFLMIFFGAFTQAFSKVAYIFIAPNLSRFTKDLNANRCILEKMDLEFMGYEVRIDFNGTEKRILQAILDPDVKSITYFGHGGSGSGSFWTPAKEPTLGAWNASSWMMTMEDALREKYIAQGIPEDRAFQMAAEECHNFGLERMVNYSCYSLVTTQIADLFVKPGGIYYGTPNYYSPFPPGGFLPNADTFLTKYIVKGSSTNDETEARNIVAKDILVKESEIGKGFRFFHDNGTDDNSVSVQFKNSDTNVTINVYIQKKRNTAAHESHRNDYEIFAWERSTDSRYVVESLNLGGSAHIIKTGKANYEAEAFPGKIWHLWVTGSYYSFSRDYERNAPKVKLAVTNAITAMYNRVIELEGR